MRINELRRSSAAIPKQSAARQLIEFAEKNGTDGYFVSFTKLEKLGIYPQSVYYTPLGIYAYPLDYPSCEAKTPAFMPWMKRA